MLQEFTMENAPSFGMCTFHFIPTGTMYNVMHVYSGKVSVHHESYRIAGNIGGDFLKNVIGAI